MTFIDFNSDFFQNLPDGNRLIPALDSISNVNNKTISDITFGSESAIVRIFERVEYANKFVVKESGNDLIKSYI